MSYRGAVLAILKYMSLQVGLIWLETYKMVWFKLIPNCNGMVTNR